MKTITYNPDTHRLVSVEPTDEIQEAIYAELEKGEWATAIYQAMLSAAPQPPSVNSASENIFGYFCDWGNDSYGLQRIAMYYGEPGNAISDDWNEHPKVCENLPLYTSPPDARIAELEKQRDELLKGIALAMPVIDAHAGETRKAWFYEAVNRAKGGAA